MNFKNFMDFQKYTGSTSSVSSPTASEMISTGEKQDDDHQQYLDFQRFTDYQNFKTYEDYQHFVDFNHTNHEAISLISVHPQTMSPTLFVVFGAVFVAGSFLLIVPRMLRRHKTDPDDYILQV